MQPPFVSVLMTAYNREQFIAEAIESVLASTYQNFELIICDDCSQDRTVEIARAYAQKDNRVQVYVNEKNLGQFPNRNRAASYAKGKYIKYLDSDDTISDWGLAYCVEEMEKFPEAAMGTYYVHSAGTGESECWLSEKIVREHFFVRYMLTAGPTATIIKREPFINAGCFDPRFGVPSDVFFNVKFASAHPVVLLPKLFVQYRRHDGQEINNSMDYLKYGYLYFKELLTKVNLPLTSIEKKYLYGKMQKRYAINLTKYTVSNKSITKTLALMKETRFSKTDFFTAFFK